MKQYDIRPQRFNGSVTVAADPYRTVGVWNFLDVNATVYGAQLAAGAPAVWNVLADDDPVIALFVAASTVNSAGWSGYHFWAPSLGALAGWPLSNFIRPAIPWLIVRVPDSAGLTSPTAMAGATGFFSHEILEAASDPYPFSGWADLSFGNAPVWANGEVTDICGVPPTAPWGSMTRIIPGGAVLSTYWSNRDRACVPESRPTLQLFGVAEGQRLRRDQAVITALASDPLDGDISNRVTWSDTAGTALPSGRVLDLRSRRLGIGSHTVTASVTDSQGLTASKTVTFSLYADQPSVTIHAPVDGASLGEGVVRFRGSATDPQDNVLTGSSLVWRVDGTQVGTGAEISWPLTVGDHTITLTATNSDGVSAEAAHQVHVVAGAPVVTITQPANGTHFQYGFTDPITFTAAAIDPQEGTLSGASVQWYDSYNGVTNQPIGQGAQISSTLVWSLVDSSVNRPTTHTLTVVARDADGHMATDALTVTVGVIIG